MVLEYKKCIKSSRFGYNYIFILVGWLGYINTLIWSAR